MRQFWITRLANIFNQKCINKHDVYVCKVNIWNGICACRAVSRFMPSQWETSLQSNAVSHWLGTNRGSPLAWRTAFVFNWLIDGLEKQLKFLRQKMSDCRGHSNHSSDNTSGNTGGQHCLERCIVWWFSSVFSVIITILFPPCPTSIHLPGKSGLNMTPPRWEVILDVWRSLDWTSFGG